VKTLDGREIIVLSEPGEVEVFVKKRRVLCLPRGAADDLAEALDKQGYGDAEVAATDDGTRIRLYLFNDELWIYKGDRAVLKAAYSERYQLGGMIARPKEGDAATGTTKDAFTSPTTDGPAEVAKARPAVPTVTTTGDDADPKALALSTESDSGDASNPFVAPAGASGEPLPKADAGAKEGVSGVGAKPPPEHRSNSQVKQWGECGHYYWLMRMSSDEPERPSVASLAGTAMHRMRERYERVAWNVFKQPFKTCEAVWPTPDQAVEWFIRYFTQEIAETADQNAGTEWRDPLSWKVAAKGTETIAWWYEQGPKFAHATAVKMTPDRGYTTLALDGKLFIEQEIEYTVAGKPYKGIIDWVTIDKEGYVDVTDSKSGQKPSDRGFQVVTYAHIIQRMYPQLQVRAGTYYDLRTNEETYYPLDRWSWEEIEHVYEMADRGISNGIFLPVVGRHCDWCSAKRICEFGSKKS
jgi:PD-(D/E)XK nuclease superfamily protein